MKQRSLPRRRRRYHSHDPVENVSERICAYHEELDEFEHYEPEEGEPEAKKPTRPLFEFEELAAVAQDCIRALNPHPYYKLCQALSFADEETAAKFQPLRDLIARLRLAAVDVDRETVELRAAMIEREIGRG